MITDVHAYFARGCGRCNRFDTDACSARRWNEGLAALRRICLASGLTETAKWGHPCYTYHDRNVAILGAFRADFRLSFFDAALLQDPHGLLERQGAHAQHPDTIRFTHAKLVAALEPTLIAYLTEAMGYAEAGIRPAKTPRALVLPDELVEALHADPELAEAFHRLTPGRQRSYVIHVSSAKKAATRRARITRARDKILAGKGYTER